MKKKIRRLMLSASALALAAALLGGCGEAGEPPEQSFDLGELNVPPVENAAFTISGGWLSSEDGRDFYCPGTRILTHYDTAARELTALCSASGCLHVDESCEAWIGEDVALFTVYGGCWYSVSNSAFGSTQFRRIDPETRQREVIASFDGMPDSWYTTLTAYVSHGCIYAELYESAPDGEGGGREFMVRIDLESLELRTLFEDSSTLEFAGSDGEKLLILASSMAREPLSPMEYAELEPEGDYSLYRQAFIAENLHSELRLYDSGLSGCETVAEGGVRLSGMLGGGCYGDLTLYAVDGSLYCYDFAAGGSRCLTEHEGLVNFFALDGKAFSIVNNGALELYYLALDGGEEVKMGNRWHDDVLAFTPYAENGAYIYGLLVGSTNQRGLLSKEDYFAENYGAIYVAN